jgi:hypothetical protein
MRWLLRHGEERGKEEVETSRALQADREIMVGCINSNCLTVNDGSREVAFYRYGEDRRCTLCHRWRQNHGGEERGREEVETSHARQADKEIMAGYRNPNCLQISDGRGKVSCYTCGDDRRCTLCHLWRKNHGGEDRSAEAVLKSLSRKGSKEGCKNEACMLN